MRRNLRVYFSLSLSLVLLAALVVPDPALRSASA